MCPDRLAATCDIRAGIIAKFGVGGLALVTLMAGAMVLVMGFTSLGAAVKFIPRPTRRKRRNMPYLVIRDKRGFMPYALES